MKTTTWGFMVADSAYKSATVGAFGCCALAGKLHRSEGMAFIASQLVETVIGCAIEVHRALGPGLLESTYDRCLAHEFGLRGLDFVRQCPLPVVYKGVHLDCGYRIDYIIGARLVVELKAVEHLLPIHQAQVLTYLKLLQIKQGLLINFNTPVLRAGLKSLLL